NTSCPENFVFHFISTHRRSELYRTISETFPYLRFNLYHFDSNLVKGKISSSIRRALDQPLNYARIYLADLLPSTVRRIIYFDSDLVVVDDVTEVLEKMLFPDLMSRIHGGGRMMGRFHGGGRRKRKEEEEEIGLGEELGGINWFG
ncbi:Probable galacturonosyltransferase-like 3, partial [Linum perenne]